MVSRFLFDSFLLADRPSSISHVSPQEDSGILATVPTRPKRHTTTDYNIID
jgi:hypothetical protein